MTYESRESERDIHVADTDMRVIAESLKGFQMLFDQRLREHGDKLDSIHEQTQKTNGRVSKLERIINYIKGGAIVVGFLISYPFLARFISEISGK